MIKSIKMFALAVVMVLSLSGVGIACAGNDKDNLSQNQTQGQLQGQTQLQTQGQLQGQAQSSINNNDIKNTNNNDIRNTNTNFNTNLNNTTSKADSKSISNSSSKSNSKSNANNSFEANINYNNDRDVLNTPQVVPFEVPILQGGKIGDMTDVMPNFANPVLIRLTRYDYIVSVLDVYYGNIFSRITYDELEQYLLKKAANYDAKKKIRYSVKYKDSVSSGGVGGGVAGSLVSGNGLDGGTLSVLPGIHRSTADPIFIITFYEVK